MSIVEDYADVGIDDGDDTSTRLFETASALECACQEIRSAGISQADVERINALSAGAISESDYPISIFTQHKSRHNVVPALEAVSATALGLIAAAVAAATALIWKIYKWIWGNKDDDGGNLDKISNVIDEADEHMESVEELGQVTNVMASDGINDELFEVEYENVSTLHNGPVAAVYDHPEISKILVDDLPKAILAMIAEMSDTANLLKSAISDNKKGSELITEVTMTPELAKVNSLVTTALEKIVGKLDGTPDNANAVQTRISQLGNALAGYAAGDRVVKVNKFAPIYMDGFIVPSLLAEFKKNDSTISSLITELESVEGHLNSNSSEIENVSKYKSATHRIQAQAQMILRYVQLLGRYQSALAHTAITMERKTGTAIKTYLTDLESTNADKAQVVKSKFATKFPKLSKLFGGK